MANEYVVKSIELLNRQTPIIKLRLFDHFVQDVILYTF